VNISLIFIVVDRKSKKCALRSDLCFHEFGIEVSVQVSFIHSVCLVVQHSFGLMSRFYSVFLRLFSLWITSDERSAACSSYRSIFQFLQI